VRGRTGEDSTNPAMRGYSLPIRVRRTGCRGEIRKTGEGGKRERRKEGKQERGQDGKKERGKEGKREEGKR
jgi:hypothetical protein